MSFGFFLGERRMNQKRKALFLVTLAFLVTSLYLAWSHFTTLQGKQKATFTATKKNYLFTYQAVFNTAFGKKHQRTQREITHVFDNLAP